MSIKPVKMLSIMRILAMKFWMLQLMKAACRWIGRTLPVLRVLLDKNRPHYSAI